MAIQVINTVTRPDTNIPWTNPAITPSNHIGEFQGDGRVISYHVEETLTSRTFTAVFRDADALVQWNSVTTIDWPDAVSWYTTHGFTQTVTRNFNYTP
jgi:hypothetical protein